MVSNSKRTTSAGGSSRHDMIKNVMKAQPYLTWWILSLLTNHHTGLKPDEPVSRHAQRTTYGVRGGKKATAASETCARTFVVEDVQPIVGEQGAWQHGESGNHLRKQAGKGTSMSRAPIHNGCRQHHPTS